MDCRNNENLLEKEAKENYDQKMILYKDDTFTKLNNDRFARDHKLLQEFLDFKIRELKNIQSERE